MHSHSGIATSASTHLTVQVAFGLLQFLSSVGTSGSGRDAVNAPVGLNTLLQQYQLPPNPLKNVMHGRMDREPLLFERRPLEEQVLQYAGGRRRAPAGGASWRVQEAGEDT